MWVCVMISARSAGWVSVYGKNSNVAIFLDSMNMIIVTLCTMIVLKVTAVPNSSDWKCFVHIRLCWNCVRLFIMSSRSWTYHYFFRTCSGEMIDVFPRLKKKKGCLFSDSFKTTSFKLCMVITLFGVYIVTVGLMTLALFQGHGCVSRQQCKLQIVLFDSHKKCECVIISVRPGRPVKCPCVAKTLPLQFSRTL